MTRRAMIGMLLLAAISIARGLADDNLAGGFTNPPDSAKSRVYWWWLNGYATYHDIAVLAWPTTEPPIEAKRTASSSAQCLSTDVLDLTDQMDPTGRLGWDVPEGHWLVVRFGWRVHARAHTKCTGGERYLEIDPLSVQAMDRHFANTAGVVIEDVAPYVGKTFNYLHIDSGEIGEPDWTPGFRDEFKHRRGYDPFPYLAAKAGITIENPDVTQRFLEDYDRTLSDLLVECFYQRLGDLGRPHGLKTHSEAAGYQKPSVDALRSMGANDICMSEFWSRRSETGDSYIHQLAAQQLLYHDGIKNASSSAHVYGRRIVQAEAYTVMGHLNSGPVGTQLRAGQMGHGPATAARS
ncbi:MAG: glycosyl hydrolase [Pirellulales bacterium]